MPTATTSRLARVTDRIARALAGKRWIPFWGLVHHRGRRTGRDLTVPIAVVATPDGFIVNLPWGTRTNWVQNVLAAGGCTLRWKGTDHRVTDPRLLEAEEARPFYSNFQWNTAKRFFPADAWLLLHRAQENPAGL
ncbi:nitroreductase family deazaflavin-dependent oxidoreductase [Actinoplanes sp. NPDC051861]|uniref:nitroreductase family deazaflavin-dependent oxidoreductase n=1 Tax=Actinoplanes sp. NPDC051861 TaxID=3155170 RepID=UPI00343A6928